MAQCITAEGRAQAATWETPEEHVRVNVQGLIQELPERELTVSFPRTHVTVPQPIRLDLLTDVAQQWCPRGGRLKGASIGERRQTCALSSRSGGGVIVVRGGVVVPWVRLPAFHIDG